MPAAHVVDMPRFEWRGAMLDVARHFLRPDDVKRFIDLLALYKLNRLHLHLADDQGWRIEIKSWPNLTAIGGQTQIGGGRGGFYTQEQYADIVAYARSRYITVVPEIDMPGHSNAALVAVSGSALQSHGAGAVHTHRRAAEHALHVSATASTVRRRRRARDLAAARRRRTSISAATKSRG